MLSSLKLRATFLALTQNIKCPLYLTLKTNNILYVVKTVANHWSRLRENKQFLNLKVTNSNLEKRHHLHLATT